MTDHCEPLKKKTIWIGKSSYRIDLYDVPVGFVTPPPPILRLCIALFAVVEGWLLLDIGWFVLFFMYISFTFSWKILFPEFTKNAFRDY